MLLHRVSQFIDRNRLLYPKDSVIIGVSGGPDSIALLHILAHILPAPACIAVYIDHGLRPHETDREIAVARAAAEQVGAVFHTETIPVAEYAVAEGCSLEEAARILRYRALEGLRGRYRAKTIAVAHTADDQVEEFFVRLCRGSGLKGLSGMNARNGTIIRPFLLEKKQTLLHYLEQRHLPFCLDSSNQDRRFLRNRVRLDLLPALEDHYNPAIRQTVLQTMDILREEDDLLDSLTDKALSTLGQTGDQAETASPSGQIEIPLDLFATEHPALQRRMLEKICWQVDCRPGFRQIDQILYVLQKGENGSEMHLQGGLRVRKMPGKILFSYPAGRSRFRGSGHSPVAIDASLPGPGIYTFSGIGKILSIRLENPAVLPQFGDKKKETLYLDAREITFPLQLRSVSPGQRFRPFGAQGSKKVNRFLTDRKIAAHERGLSPVLLLGERVIALPGLEIDHDFRLTSSCRSVLVVDWRQIPPEDLPASTDL
ncbi:MAG: tRNA lysidine(34) synthetase TilS [Desulfoprunum sp.]|nr:tRNA lysidine(34) synthetase TilS [Desulfoprunum sp.]